MIGWKDVSDRGGREATPATRRSDAHPPRLYDRVIIEVDQRGEGGGMLGDHPVFPILLSTDLDASRTFYHDVLGLDILREDPDDRIVFRCGGGTQLAVTASTVGTIDIQTQLAWRVPDIHAAVAELRARGVRIEEYTAPDPVTVDGIADMGHSWAAWFIDPSRNVLAVVQPKP
jgi:catechol 2,3-dioxygenase-like lactoylglutathione lyase family enzyme